MTKKVSVPLMRLLVLSGEVPIHWQRRPSLLVYEWFQTLWKYGCCLSCRYSKVYPVALSRTITAHLCMRADGYVRRAAAWVESVVDCRALERVREATGASVVKSLDQVRGTNLQGCRRFTHHPQTPLQPAPDLGTSQQTLPSPPTPAPARDNQQQSLPTPLPDAPTPPPSYTGGPFPYLTNPQDRH